MSVIPQQSWIRNECFSNAHEYYQNRYWGQKWALTNLQKNEIIPNIFSEHNGIKLNENEIGASSMCHAAKAVLMGKFLFLNGHFWGKIENEWSKHLTQESG